VALAEQAPVVATVLIIASKVYVTVIGEFVAFVNVSVILLSKVPAVKLPDTAP
jgi:hypothetical protein